MRVLGILALTHSSRPVGLERCSVQFLTRRFSHPGRLRQVPAFERLPPARQLYSGAVSFYRVGLDERGRFRVESLGSVRRRRKLQHVVFSGEREMLVGYEHYVERWTLADPVEGLPRLGDRAISVGRRFEHPHLAGLHTVDPVMPGAAALACSSPDAVLFLDLSTGVVRRELRMPEDVYGHNYDLTPEMDLRRHYIDDDWQRTHINAASVSHDGRWMVVSTLIQGAVGVFDLEDGGYRELTRGFVGCHGARFDDRGRIYFADSTTGALVFLDGGRIARRFAVRSPWLHDVQQIEGSVYAFALCAPNELRIYDVDRQQLLFRKRFFTWPFRGLYPLARRWPWWLGDSAQALSFRPADTSSTPGPARSAAWPRPGPTP